jgi:iron(III) transport system ATP-binding protein
VTVAGLVAGYGSKRAVDDIELAVGAGLVLTLLGPSGCGKTTTLRTIAGLETPQAGRITIDGQVVFDAAAGLDLPPEQRGLSMVFQSYAIWPHMTVFENVAFGLRARLKRSERGRIVPAVLRSLDMVGLTTLADRPATRLSGGQQQRVALARAIACDTGVILLDEPLSNLDAQLRVAMRDEFKSLQRRLGLTAIYVTHDQEEALVLSDYIAVMRDGRIEQAGTPASIFGAPASRFVADFFGVQNLFACTLTQHAGGVSAVLPGNVRLATLSAVPFGPAFVCFRPFTVRLSASPTPGSFAAVMTAASFAGDFITYELTCGPLTIAAKTLPRSDLAVGSPVYWSVPPESCFLVRA